MDLADLFLLSQPHLISNLQFYNILGNTNFKYTLAMYCLRSLLLLFYTLNLTWGWGDVGHRTVAYLAEKYLTKQGNQLVEDLISPSDEFDISDAAVWPDKVKFSRPYSRNWHFIGVLR